MFSHVTQRSVTLPARLIRDRIVVGVRDKALSERMQLDSELTLEKAVKMVRQQEAVRQQQVDLQRPSTSQKVNQVKFNSKNFSPKQQQQPSRKKEKSAKTRSRCPKCGGFTHREGQACRAEGQKCNLCSKTGHFANCCPDKQAKTAEVKAVSELDEEIGFLLEVSAVEDSSNLDDDEGECRRRWTAEIQVNGKQVKFKLDSQADVTCVPLCLFKKIMGQQRLVESDINIRAAEFSELQTVGMFISTLRNGNYEIKEKIYVIRRLSEPLLSRRACELLNLARRIEVVATRINQIKEFPEVFEGLGQIGNPYEIVHIPGKELLDADALSRQPLLTTEGGEDERPTSAHVNAVLSGITDKDEMLTKIFEAQQEDTTLKAVVNYLEQGWPNKKKMSQALLSYWHVKDELGVQNGLLMRSCRLVIPASMKLEILDKLHAGHFGITKTRLRARETVWWPGISEEIAETVRKCSVCIQEAVSKHEPLIPTNFPTRPWQKIGMDLFKFENKWYLVVIDYYSRFPEMIQLDRLTAIVVVRSCKSIFARHGIPETVVSDNGTQFGAAREFANFARQYGFTHVTSSPRFPQSNGMAEAGVKIAKLILKKNQDPSLGLLEYRSTPLENGYSPAELLMGRKLRTTLPIAPENLNPRLVDSQTLKRKEGRRRKDMKSRYDRRCGATDMEELSEGDTVWITDMRTWGIVKKKASTPRSYMVDTPVGTLRRNRFHLRKGVTVQYPADPSTPTFSGEELVENEKTPVVDYPSNDSEDGQIRTRSGRIVKPGDVLRTCTRTSTYVFPRDAAERDLASTGIRSWLSLKDDLYHSFNVPSRRDSCLSPSEAKTDSSIIFDIYLLILCKLPVLRTCKKTSTYVFRRDAAERGLGCTGDCEFEGLHEQLIRDRMVVGVRDKALSERMQLDSELTLEKAVKMVRQQEAVRQQQVDLQRPSASQKVNQVKFNSKKQSPKQQQQPSRKKEKSAKTRSRCPKCGGFTHREGQACRAEGQRCNLCSKTGHFANCCPDKQAKTAEVKAVSELDEEIGFVLEVSAAEDSSNLDDDEGECRRRWTAEIQVNGKQLKFKLDSQADVTCVPLCLFKKIMGQQRLVESDINIRAAEFSELQTVGMFISTLRNGNYEIKEKIYVIRRLSEPLLSRRACELLNLARRVEVVATRINPIKEFPEVFEGLGQIGNPYEIKLKPGAKPYAVHTPRRVPIPLMEKLKTIVHIPGKELLDADALSRQPLLTTEGGEDERPTSAHINAVLSSITDKDEMLTKIFEAQQEDTTLKAVVNYLEQGWPDKKKMSQALLSYWHVKDELGVQNGLLMRGCRLVVPAMVQLNRLTANVVVRSCKSIFARHGVPETVVSDNGTQFGAAREFANFARQYGFTHVTSSPRFPQSNGMAEAGVKIAKLILKKNQDPSLGLLEYRSTPLENGYSPAELLMGRKLRTTLPIAPENLNPKLVDSQTLKRKEGRRRKDMKSRYDRRCGATDMEELSEGDTVWITDMRTWGIVKQKASTPRSYMVDTPVGTLRRNRFHLRKGVTVQYPADPSTPTFSGEELVENEKTPVVDHPSNDSEDGQIRTRSGRIVKPVDLAFHFQTPSRVLIIPNCMLQLPLKRLRFNQISPFASNNKKFRNDIATERLSRQDKEMELNQDQDIMELNQDPIGVKSDGPTETTTEGRQEVRETGETTAPLADAVNQLSTLLTRVKISDGAESTIPPFDGTYNATQFFQAFDRKMEDASMGEQEKLLRLPNYLARQPLELFRKLRMADRSYFQVRQILLDLYPESSEASFAKYFAMKLTGQANLETYYREKTAMGLQLGLPQEVILETLTEGLPFNDQRLVRVVPPENLGEWFRLVQRIHGPSVPATRSREDQPPTMSGPYHSTPRRPGAWNAPLPPSNCKFCGARHWHSECRRRPVPTTHEKVRTVQTVPKSPVPIPQQPTNCLFYMPSNNQTTTTSTYEPVQNAPTQRDNSHTKNIGDHTPLHNSHITNPHNELDTHTNTQQNPCLHSLPKPQIFTCHHSNLTPRNFSLNPIANTLCPQHIKPQDGFHTHNTRTHTSSHNGNTHNQPNKRDTHTKRRHQPVNTYTIVKNNTIIPSTQNIEKIHATKQPHNRKTLRSFLKAVNTYKEFIPDHARLRTPFVNLLKKDVMWVWDDERQKAFTNLKESLTTHPTLHLYQEGLPCQVYCNTSTFSITGVLKQVYPDGKTYTVQHFSRSLRSHERNYSDLELQCLAIVESVDNFRTCLMGRKFTIFSDRPALQWLKEIKAPSGRLFRWRLRLSRYEYAVRSINGVQQYETGVGTHIPFCGFLDAPLIQNQQSSPPRKSRVTMDHNKLRTVSRKGVLKTIVPSSLTTRLLKSVHTQHHHPNISKMTRLISSQYYWQNMTQDIAKQVKTCPTCRFARRIDEYNQPSRKNTDTGTKAKQNSYIKHSVHTTQTMPKLPHPRQRNDHTSQPKPITADISLIKPLTIKQENCKPDNQLNHITPLPKDIKQENCEPTNHSNSTINKNNTIIPSTQNIEKIHTTKQPHNRKALRSFLKAVNAYKEFIPDHARLRTPLVNLLKKDVVWVWDDKCQKAFTNLKENLTTHPTLHLYQEDLPCQVYCNTSTFSITGVLKQVYPDGKTYTVQHFSRSLRSHERNYSDLELQCLAIVESVDNFRTCLMDRKFTIFSDHPALQWLKEIKAPSGRLFRWRLRLSRYEYEVRSINGVQQYETGVGTRIPFCGFLDAPLIQSQQSSPPGKSRVTMDHNKLRTVSRKGVLKTIVPSSLTTRLLKSVHTQHHHPNISKMTRLISAQYYWQNMTQDIAKQVKTCPTCRFARRIDEYKQPARKNTDTGTQTKQNSYIKHSVHTTQIMPKLPHPRQRKDHTSQPKPITTDISLIKPLTIKQENYKPDKQFNHTTSLPKDIKQENCEPTNHSNSTIYK
ncbi:K02A2.6-like, partial [Cordylochernes scorpioides]